jgi:hypothetical protein
MGKSRKIAIIVHPRDKFHAMNNLLKLLAREWQQFGHQVSIAYGPRDAREADCAVLHVDLTRIPQEYTAMLERYPVVINGSVHDISKRFVSTHLVRRGDRYGGPVIVKTDRNAGGESERRLGHGGWWGKRLSGMARRLPWSWTGRLRSKAYPVFESPRHVPRSVWFNRRLVVEKFLTERRGDYYCLRQWIFFGNCERNVILFSRHPIVKANNIEYQEDIDGAPQELRRARRRLGFDYGKFDYAVVNGEVVLYDANRTPTYSRNPPSLQTLTTVRLLAGGLMDFFR